MYSNPVQAPTIPAQLLPPTPANEIALADLAAFANPLERQALLPTDAP